jgi:outer membrane lipoprotein-sorting protein
VKLFRTLPGRRLALLLAAVAAVAAAAAVIAVTASGGGGPTPPPKPLAQAVRDALATPQPEVITARITFTNRLFPSGALLGNVGSALMSGASGRLWITNDGRGRLELQSNAGDVQLVWNGEHVTVYDASSNTVYEADVPKHGRDRGVTPSLADIAKALTGLREHASISGAEPADVAGRSAYRVTVSPKHDGGLLGSAQLAWDAERGVPLDVAIVAQGSSSPVLELKATAISYGPVHASDVAISPPHGTKTVSLGSEAGKARQGGAAAKTAVGLVAVRAVAGFPVVAPSTLVGLPRRDVRAIGNGSKTVLVAYGRGLGGIFVVERKAGPGAGAGGMLSSLPKVSVDGLTAHELATQLGTALQWRRSGVEFVLAGSVPPAAAEAAARDLR